MLLQRLRSVDKRLDSVHALIILSLQLWLRVSACTPAIVAKDGGIPRYAVPGIVPRRYSDVLLCYYSVQGCRTVQEWDRVELKLSIV